MQSKLQPLDSSIPISRRAQISSIHSICLRIHFISKSPLFLIRQSWSPGLVRQSLWSFLSTSQLLSIKHGVKLLQLLFMVNQAAPVLLSVSTIQITKEPVKRSDPVKLLTLRDLFLMRPMFLQQVVSLKMVSVSTVLERLAKRFLLFSPYLWCKFRAISPRLHTSLANTR